MSDLSPARVLVTGGGLTAFGARTDGSSVVQNTGNGYGMAAVVATGDAALFSFPRNIPTRIGGKGEELYKDKLIPAVKEGAQAAGRNAEDIDRAATAASLAFKAWRDMAAPMRRKLLHRVADAIARLARASRDR